MSTVLEARLRPWAVFNVQDSQHREWYYQFLVTNSWSHCPVRFAARDGDAELIGWIQRELLTYYGKKEFKRLKLMTKKAMKLPIDPVTVESFAA